MRARTLWPMGLALLSLVCPAPVGSQVIGGIVGGGPAQPRPGMGQPRDPRQMVSQTGTASVSGRVTAVDTGMPLRRVQVRVSGQDLRGMRSATTDAEGRYAVARLPAGRYTISFVKGGFANMQYGQKRPNQPGKQVDLGDGQKLDNLDIALVRGGVIAGRVVDDFGEPVVDARVQVMQLRWLNGRRRLMSTGRMNQTNDRGEFRVWGLGAGDYYVSASGTDRPMFMDAALAAVEESEQSGFAPTYYPGTANMEEAQKVTLAAGQEVTGVDFALVTTRLLRVSGTAMGSDGRPMANASVMMFPRTAMEGGGMMMPQGGRTDMSGSFTIPNVAPGEYVLQARVDRGPRGDADGQEGASATVSVGSEDVKNVLLVAAKGVRVSGRIVFEGQTPTAAVKERLRVFLPALDSDRMMFGGGGGGNVEVNPEGTFEVTGISGRRTFAISAEAPWVLKAAKIGGTDTLDTGYEFGKEDVGNVELVLTSNPPTLAGSVRGDNNATVSDYVVIAFSTDESVWQQSPMRRGYGIGRPDQNGTFKITSLRPGSYYVIALDGMPEDLGNPDLFKALKDRAKQVGLRDGQSEQLELVLQSAPIS